MKEKKILVIEDIDSLRRQYTKGLKNAGYYVEDAATASEARNRISRVTFDLAIVDLNLPENPGDRAKLSAGLEILEIFSNLDEGTHSLVISIQPSPQIAADIVKDYDTSYLSKSTLQSKGLSFLLEHIAGELENHALNIWGGQ